MDVYVNFMLFGLLRSFDRLITHFAEECTGLISVINYMDFRKKINCDVF